MARSHRLGGSFAQFRFYRSLSRHGRTLFCPSRVDGHGFGARAQSVGKLGCFVRKERRDEWQGGSRGLGDEVWAWAGRVMEVVAMGRVKVCI